MFPKRLFGKVPSLGVAVVRIKSYKLWMIRSVLCASTYVFHSSVPCLSYYFLLFLLSTPELLPHSRSTVEKTISWETAGICQFSACNLMCLGLSIHQPFSSILDWGLTSDVFKSWPIHCAHHKHSLTSNFSVFWKMLTAIQNNTSAIVSQIQHIFPNRNAQRKWKHFS